MYYFYLFFYNEWIDGKKFLSNMTSLLILTQEYTVTKLSAIDKRKCLKFVLYVFAINSEKRLY